MKEIYGGIEAGGTKFVCAIGSDPNDISDEVRFPTTTPDETIKKCIEYFELQKKKINLKSIGVGSFGPLDLRPDSDTYGYITLTNKPGWTNTNFLGKLIPLRKFVRFSKMVVICLIIKHLSIIRRK